MRSTQVKKRGPQSITQDVILSSTTLTRSSQETTEEYLGRVTHLHLQAKRIYKLENLELCTNLKVLYLYDNFIEKIENLEHASNLQYLQLQNNKITEVPSLQMPQLTKLYLDENAIPFLTGLEKCTKLEELRLANQSLPPEISFQIDQRSLTAFSRTLHTLDISNCGIVDLSPYAQLQNLKKLYCADNKVSSLDDMKALMSLRLLTEVNFKGNPACAIRKYRDQMIGASSDSLTMLDEVPVLKHQQVAIKGLIKHRSKIVGLGMLSAEVRRSEEQQQMSMTGYEFENAESVDISTPAKEGTSSAGLA